MLTIGQVKIGSPLILAPLAGYSDLPFRLLCREFGAGMCVSEMISCHGLAYRQAKTLTMLATSSDDSPVSYQLFGADVAMMAKATEILNDYSPAFIDINMGCPVKKVTKKGAGAALMSNPVLAQNIIKTVVNLSNFPVTVKIRKGVDSTSVNCIEFAKMAEDAGAAAVTVHGRTWSQGFTGSADWQVIKEVKQSVSIPVIGNGDICSYEHALSRIDGNYCDGVMVGRGALGNPWVFHPADRPDNLNEIITAALRHLQLMQEHIDTKRLLAVVKNHIGRYFKQQKGCSVIRKNLYDCDSFEKLRDYIQSLSNQTP